MERIRNILVDFAINHYKSATFLMVFFTLITGAFLPEAIIDTDPENKLLSYKIYTELNQKIQEPGGNEEYHITGLPIAEDAVGVEMFTQMGTASPLAMAVIFGQFQNNTNIYTAVRYSFTFCKYRLC